MSITYSLERGLGLVVARSEPSFTCETLCEHLEAISGDDAIPTGSHELLDLTGTSDFSCTVPDLSRVADAVRSRATRLRRLAVVCEHRSVLERLLLLQELAKGASVELGVFAGRTSAAAWLHVRDDELQNMKLAPSTHG